MDREVTPIDEAVGMIAALKFRVAELEAQMGRAAIACSHGESKVAQEILNKALGL